MPRVPDTPRWHPWHPSIGTLGTHWSTHNTLSWVLGTNGYFFLQMDWRLQDRFHQLVSEHAHSVSAAVHGLSALPSTALALASVKAMSRFLHNEAVTLPALIEPVQEQIRVALASSASPDVLILHDWSWVASVTSNSDCLVYGRHHSRGYDLGTALVVDAADGRPLGPMELRLRTAEGVLTTRPGDPEVPDGHINELSDVMAEAKRWNLGRRPVHVVDREGDSSQHYLDWSRAHHRFVVRADDGRIVTFRGREMTLANLGRDPGVTYSAVRAADGSPLRVTTPQGAGRVQVAEALITLDRPSTRRRDGQRIYRPAPHLSVRLVIVRVVDDRDQLVAIRFLMTHGVDEVSATTIAQWYAWRWRIESYHKLLKSAGLNIERWEQTTGEAVAKRLVVASMACLAVWHLQRDPRPEAATLRRYLIRLSGRQMKYQVESTAPALLAGLDKLLALDDLQSSVDLTEVLTLARQTLPHLFRSG